MKASLLNYDSHSTSGLDVKQHERLQNTDRVLGTGHYVRRGGRKKKEEGGAFLFRGGPQFDRKVYFKRDSSAKMGKAVKQ